MARIKESQDRQVAKVQKEPRSIESRKAWQSLCVLLHLKRVRDH